MDKRIDYKIVIDTETCPMDKDFEGVSPFNMWTYDIGWAVVDRKGKVYRTRSFIAREIFCQERQLMKSAYYASKIPMYIRQIAEKQRTIEDFYKIKMTLWDDMAEFGVTQVYAHNMRFDYNTLNNTQRWLSKSKYRYFFPYGTEICDTLSMARDVIAKQPTYKKFCTENGYVLKNGACRLTAEILYRYISGDNTFEEKHTGIEDVLIEKEIMAYCYRQHKPMKRLLWAENLEDKEDDVFYASPLKVRYQTMKR